MNLYQFQPNVGSSEAYAIKARLLDDNFRKLTPKSNGTYGINEDNDGWTFNIFPPFPNAVQQAVYLSYNGRRAGITGASIETSQVGLQWSPIELDAENFVSDGAELNAHFVADGNGGASWSYPPSGEPAWRQVERCDGKKMWVWGTDWE